MYLININFNLKIIIVLSNEIIIKEFCCVLKYSRACFQCLICNVFDSERLEKCFGFTVIFSFMFTHIFVQMESQICKNHVK